MEQQYNRRSSDKHMDRLEAKIDKLAEAVYKNNGIKRLVEKNAEAISGLSTSFAEHCTEAETIRTEAEKAAKKKRIGFSHVIAVVTTIVAIGGVLVAILALK